MLYMCVVRMRGEVIGFARCSKPTPFAMIALRYKALLQLLNTIEI